MNIVKDGSSLHPHSLHSHIRLWPLANDVTSLHIYTTGHRVGVAIPSEYINKQYSIKRPRPVCTFYRHMGP